VVLSSVSNRTSPSPTTLKSSCASADNLGLIDDTTELATEVRCDNHTHEDIIGMLTEPTHCGLWIACVDAKSAPHAKHTARRKELA
jgi:hypothetical protein